MGTDLFMTVGIIAMLIFNVMMLRQWMIVRKIKRDLNATPANNLANPGVIDKLLMDLDQSEQIDELQKAIREVQASLLTTSFGGVADGIDYPVPVTDQLEYDAKIGCLIYSGSDEPTVAYTTALDELLVLKDSHHNVVGFRLRVPPTGLPVTEPFKVPTGYALVPIVPPRGLLISMAMRTDHSFNAPVQDGVLPGIISGHTDEWREVYLKEMAKAHEEVVGTGYYKYVETGPTGMISHDTDPVVNNE